MTNIKIPIDKSVVRAFKKSLANSKEEIKETINPVWDCEKGMHEPVWVKFIGAFRCGGCFRKLGS